MATAIFNAHPCTIVRPCKQHNHHNINQIIIIIIIKSSPWWLCSAGFKHGDSVALFMENRPEYIGVRFSTSSLFYISSNKILIYNADPRCGWVVQRSGPFPLSSTSTCEDSPFFTGKWGGRHPDWISLNNVCRPFQHLWTLALSLIWPSFTT